MSAPLLALNVGSATLKFTTFDIQGREPRVLVRGLVDGIGQAEGHLAARAADGQVLCDEPLREVRHENAIAQVLALAESGRNRPGAIVHRVVHGGELFSRATRVDGEVCAQLHSLTPLAPLHQPAALAGLEAARRAALGVVQIACFDTAFHATQDPLATRFAIDRRWHDAGVRRYSFHGLSYAAISHQLPAVLGEGEADKRVVVLHLGSGSSGCVLHRRRSVANSTGMGACEGLMMGTRPGNLDPEVLLYWMEHGGMDIPAVRRELYRNSGLLGVSGESSDMRVLLASDSPQARLAVELYCYRAAREVAALAAQAGGVDHLVFTAGIGERSATVRAMILERLSWLGFALDAATNAAQAVHGGAARLSSADSQRGIWVIPTDEEGQMAREAMALLAG